MILNPGTDCVTADRRLLLTISSDQRTVSGLPASMYFYQPVFDATLRETVAALPNVEIRLGLEVQAIEPEPGGMRVVAHRADGAEAVARARWVVGCDGASRG